MMAAIRVLLLTQEHCSLCERAKRILDQVAGEYPLAVAVVDLASPEGRELAARGQLPFPPGVFLDDEPFCYGRLSERKLRRELDRRRQPGEEASTT
jgi:Glutaredoxin-like domain (DUF836)